MAFGDLNGTLTANAKWPNDIMDPANNMYGAATTYITSLGLWLPVIQPKFSDGTAVVSNQAEFQMAYMAFAQCVAAGLREDANALSFLQKRSTYKNYVLSNFGGWHLSGYYLNTYTGAAGGTFGLVGGAINSDALYCHMLGGGNWDPSVNITWSGSTLTFHNAQNGYVLANGDKFLFNSQITTLPAALTTQTAYYVVNVSGSTFQFSATLGGSPITLTSSGTIGPLLAMFLNANKATTPSDDIMAFDKTGPDQESIDGTSHWEKALGVTGLDAVIADAALRITASFAVDPKYKMQSSF